MSERLLMTVGPNPKGKGLVALVSRGGHPQLDKERCELLTLEIVPNMKAAKAWFKQMQVERPWDTRQ